MDSVSDGVTVSLGSVAAAPGGPGSVGAASGAEGPAGGFSGVLGAMVQQRQLEARARAAEAGEDCAEGAAERSAETQAEGDTGSAEAGRQEIAAAFALQWAALTQPGVVPEQGLGSGSDVGSGAESGAGSASGSDAEAGGEFGAEAGMALRKRLGTTLDEAGNADSHARSKSGTFGLDGVSGMGGPEGLGGVPGWAGSSGSSGSSGSAGALAPSIPSGLADPAALLGTAGPGQTSSGVAARDSGEPRLAASVPPVVSLQIGPQLSVLTTPAATVPGEADLIAYARGQGVDPAVIRMVFGPAAATGPEGGAAAGPGAALRARPQGLGLGGPGGQMLAGLGAMVSGPDGAEPTGTGAALPFSVATMLSGGLRGAGGLPGTAPKPGAAGGSGAGTAGLDAKGSGPGWMGVGAAGTGPVTGSGAREGAGAGSVGAAAAGLALGLPTGLGGVAGNGLGSGLGNGAVPGAAGAAGGMGFGGSVLPGLTLAGPDRMTPGELAVAGEPFGLETLQDGRLWERAQLTESPSAESAALWADGASAASRSSAADSRAQATALPVLDLRALAQESREAAAEQISKALAQRLVDQIEKGQWQLRLAVNPRELGPIDIDLRVSGQRVEAQFHVAHAQTQSLIQDSLPKLREAVGTSGMDLASVWVSGGWNQRNRGNPTPGQPDDPASAGGPGAAADDDGIPVAGVQAVDRSRTEWRPGLGSLDILI